MPGGPAAAPQSALAKRLKQAERAHIARASAHKPKPRAAAPPAASAHRREALRGPANTQEGNRTVARAAEAAEAADEGGSATSTVRDVQPIAEVELLPLDEDDEGMPQELPEEVLPRTPEATREGSFHASREATEDEPVPKLFEAEARVPELNMPGSASDLISEHEKSARATLTEDNKAADPAHPQPKEDLHAAVEVPEAGAAKHAAEDSQATHSAGKEDPDAPCSPSPLSSLGSEFAVGRHHGSPIEAECAAEDATLPTDEPTSTDDVATELRTTLAGIVEEAKACLAAGQQLAEDGDDAEAWLNTFEESDECLTQESQEDAVAAAWEAMHFCSEGLLDEPPAMPDEQDETVGHGWQQGQVTEMAPLHGGQDTMEARCSDEGFEGTVEAEAVHEEPLQTESAVGAAAPATTKPAGAVDLEGFAKKDADIHESAPEVVQERLDSDAEDLLDETEEEHRLQSLTRCDINMATPRDFAMDGFGAGKRLDPSGTGELPPSSAEDVLPPSRDGCAAQLQPAQEQCQACEVFIAGEQRSATCSIEDHEVEGPEPLVQCLEGVIDEDTALALQCDERPEMVLARGSTHAVESAWRAQKEDSTQLCLEPPSHAATEVGRGEMPWSGGTRHQEPEDESSGDHCPPKAQPALSRSEVNTQAPRSMGMVPEGTEDQDIEEEHVQAGWRMQQSEQLEQQVWQTGGEQRQREREDCPEWMRHDGQEKTGGQGWRQGHAMEMTPLHGGQDTVEAEGETLSHATKCTRSVETLCWDEGSNQEFKGATEAEAVHEAPLQTELAEGAAVPAATEPAGVVDLEGFANRGAGIHESALQVGPEQFDSDAEDLLDGSEEEHRLQSMDMAPFRGRHDTVEAEGESLSHATECTRSVETLCWDEGSNQEFKGATEAEAVHEEPLQTDGVPAATESAGVVDLERFAKPGADISESALQAVQKCSDSDAEDLLEGTEEEHRPLLLTCCDVITATPGDFAVDGLEAEEHPEASGTVELSQSAAEEVLPSPTDGGLGLMQPAQEHCQSEAVHEEGFEGGGAVEAEAVHEEPLQTELAIGAAAPATTKPAGAVDLEGFAKRDADIHESAPQVVQERLDSDAEDLLDGTEEEHRLQSLTRCDVIMATPGDFAMDGFGAGKRPEPSGTGELPRSSAEDVSQPSSDGCPGQLQPAQEQCQACEVFTAGQQGPAPGSIEDHEVEGPEPAVQCLEGVVDEGTALALQCDERLPMEEDSMQLGLEPPSHAATEAGRGEEVAGSGGPRPQEPEAGGAWAAAGTAPQSSSARPAARKTEAAQVIGTRGQAKPPRSPMRRVLLHLFGIYHEFDCKGWPKCGVPSRATLLRIMQRGICLGSGATCALFTAVELAWRLGPEPEPFI